MSGRAKAPSATSSRKHKPQGLHRAVSPSSASRAAAIFGGSAIIEGHVMRIALAVGLCLVSLALAGSADAVEPSKAQPKTLGTPSDTAQAKSRPTAQSVREDYRARLNDNMVTIMAGSAQGTDTAIVQDIAAVLDDGEALRVVPMIGKGPAQTVKEVMLMR